MKKRTNTNNHAQDIHKNIYTLAITATAGTLKTLYSGTLDKITGKIIGGSSNKKMRELRQSLQSDINELENLAYCVENDIYSDYVLSDASDLLNTAYVYLWEKIAIDGLTADTEISIILKNGTEKTRTVYQWACSEIRKAIYAEKRLEPNGKYSYIDELRQGAESTESALDRHYIRVGKYYDMGGSIRNELPSSLDGIYTAESDNYHAIQDMIEKLNLTSRQSLILHYRLQGKSVISIADSLKVSQPAISKTLKQIQVKVKTLYPNKVRAFKL